MALKHPARWLLGAIVLILIIAAPTITYPLGRDQGEFATIGRGLLDGRIPYVDLWNPKPPAVFYVYAGMMALFGRTVFALRAIDLIIFPPIAASLYWIARRAHSSPVGLWTVILFGVFYFSETFWTLTQNDGIVLLPMCVAALCALKAADPTPRAWLWALLCGAMCGWVFWFKYPFALFAAALVIGYLILKRPRLLDIVAFAIGALITAGGFALVMIHIGAWDALIESATVTAGYTALGFNADEFARAMRLALEFRWAHWGTLFILVALLPILIIIQHSRVQSIAPRQNAPSHSRFFSLSVNGSGMRANADPNTEIMGQSRFKIWGIITVWLIAALSIMLVQAKGYDYHWLPMLPPLTLLGAYSITRLITLFGRFRQTAAVFVAAALIGALAWGIGSRTLPYLTGQEDQLAYYGRFVAGEFVAAESLQVADYLRAHVQQGDSLFIWGFRPEVYYMSGLNPAARFIFHFPLVADWYPPEWRDQTVETLWAALPPYVLVLQVDYLDWVTGIPNADSNTLLQSYISLNDWLIYNYDRDTQIGNFFLWRRKS